MTKHYKEVKAKADFVEIEKEVLKFWDEDKTFEKSVHNRDGAAEFVFYDGPPFANGTPHYGHIMVSYVKDVVARYQTMNGKKVERRLGWDCHGLPAEMSAEKQLGVPAANRLRNTASKSLTISAALTFSNIPASGSRCLSASAAGWISVTITRPWICRLWKASSTTSNSSGKKGLFMRTTASCLIPGLPKPHCPTSRSIRLSGQDRQCHNRYVHA